jgi:hypothetical protein
MIGLQIFLLAAVSVVDPAMQHQLAGALLNDAQRQFMQQSHRILIQLRPALRRQIAKQAHAIVVPTPPQIARQRPQALLGRRNKTVEHARLAHHRRYFGGSVGEQTDFFILENARINRLHHDHALQHAPVNHRHAQKRLIRVFARFAEILEARMILDLFDRNRPKLFGGQPGQPFL